jgi:hypothetical protein
MDALLKLIMDQLMANPAIQGMVISVLVAKLRDFFVSLDTAAKDPAQVKWVQLLVAGLSLAATLLTAWSTGHLGQVDTNAIVAFITTLLAAFGMNSLGSSVKKQVEAAKK